LSASAMAAAYGRLYGECAVRIRMRRTVPGPGSAVSVSGTSRMPR
jgi:hypothetical protein